MKIIKIIFFSLLALSLVVCASVFIFIETFDTDQYLPQITKKASLALGRPVFIGHTGMGFSSRGITLDAGPVIVADDSGLITRPLIKLDSARISMDPRSVIHFIRQSSMNDCSGDIIITGGVIKNFNIIKTVLSHTLGSFGDMDGYIGKLGAEDTVIEKAEVKFSLHDKTVFIDDSLIKTNIFEFTAKGSVDHGLNTDLQTMLRLNEDVSAALVNDIEGLKFLCDDSKRMAIGASLKGVIPHLKYKPNKEFRKKSKKTINALFRQLFGA